MIIEREIKKYDNSFWLKVFSHFNADGAFGFEDENEAKYCINDEHKYSILSDINSRYRISGLYEFIIEYPELGTYNRWKQEDNPLDITEDIQSETVSKFDPIETKAQNTEWGGLIRTRNDLNGFPSAPSLLNGSPGSEGWFFAIGQYKGMLWTYEETKVKSIPSNDQPVNFVSLWIRLPNHIFCTYKQSIHINEFLSFLSIMIIFS